MTEVYEDDATFKELPYYKAIFKSFLKRQIQHLLEELSDETGEESIILTANINNGTLSHLGSNTGKGFLQGRDDIKTQFLAYCLKTNHSEQTQVSTSKSPYLRPASRQNIPSPAEQPVVKRARMTRSSDIPNTASISSSLLSPNVVPGLSSVPAQPVCLYPALSQPYTVTAADSDYDVEDNTTTTVEEIKTESLEGTSIERNYTHSGASALTYSDSNVLDSHDSKSSLDKSRGSVDVGNSESGPNLQSEFSANESFDLSSVVIKQELKEGDNELGLSFGDPDKIPNDVSNTGEAESQKGLELFRDVEQIEVSSDEEAETLYCDRNTLGQISNASIGSEYSYDDSYLIASTGSTGSGSRTGNNVCPTCHKVFTQSTNLRRHMRLHTGERNFVCEYCSKTFNRKDHLKLHLWSIHKTI